MARIVILLLSATIILNGLTFLVVVNQTPAPGGGNNKGSDAASARPAASSSVAPNPKLEGVERTVKSIERDVRGLVRSLLTLDKKVSALEGKMQQAAASAVSRQIARVPAEDFPPANPGDREFEYSEVPEEGPGGAVETTGVEPPEPVVEGTVPVEGMETGETGETFEEP